ncbi:phage integrase family protein [Paraburkholderia acidisoli]|uniref:Tyrosine-type recombinase/integrase n=1 Tax=Paraburkholderia acidisoli TaxID=2571748 RepID=A0A7Z2GSE9_9BURK|nr:phage integrase family protein [Paraburkholderia acidisoli]QGZ66956.1 tyrosine-type recombinase/integrase [Paraburkholderia acidisoli]
MSETLDRQRLYTAKDFAALRAFVQRLPPAVIARTYFNEDYDPHAATPGATERYLRDMLATLVELAIDHGSPVLADHLKASIRRHGSARLTAVSLKMVEDAARLAAARPAAGHGIGMWFRPLVTRYLHMRGVSTLENLVAYCNARGGSWWRSVPRIGPGRARAIVGWLRRHERDIGLHVDADVDLDDPLVAPDAEIVAIGGTADVLAPLERMALREVLDGSAGINRSTAFPYIAAHNDLAAVRAWLHLYRDRPKTLRAYTKEVERFLLWAVTVRGKALSSLLVDDCEAYKDFLKLPSPSFIGARAPRSSRRWRPFASDQLSPESQVYAVRVLRAAFAWLVDMRYLAGNPWKGVRDPETIRREGEIQIERALNGELWSDVRAHVRRRCAAAESQRWRIVHALMLLMGDSGLRREEAAAARRERLQPYVSDSNVEVWALTIVGKRNRERTVPVSVETVDALRAHWQDRGDDFDVPAAAGPLLSPLIIPHTEAARRKHVSGERMPYESNHLYRLIEWLRARLLAELQNLSPATHAQLEQTTPHAFRHTFGTLAAANDVPLDVVQRVLGHRSIQTTSIYLQAEKRRMMTEVGAMFGRRLESENQRPANGVSEPIDVASDI